MLCAEFEDHLTDYLEGTLDGVSNRAFAEHALRCPVCHELLSEVKNALQVCRVAEVPSPSRELEARILNSTVPEAAMSCEEFEDYLTDYLDGFLPAPQYHRWERHAALCERCTELPGQVVRAIGACYTYINEERPVPAGLHDRILQATLGTIDAEEVRAPLAARIAARLRMWLDPIISPQLASVATMLLVAVLVLTSTVSADGSISGMYQAGVKLIGQSYELSNPVNKGASLTDDLKQLADGISAAFSNNQNHNSTKQKKERQAAEPAK
jgi:anti-sigma factor RsiW